MTPKEEMSQLIQQLLNAQTPEEKVSLLMRVKALCKRTASQEKRTQLYYTAVSLVRKRALEIVEQLDLSPTVNAILEELESMRHTQHLWESHREFEEFQMPKALLEQLIPCSAALKQAHTPEQIHSIVQNARIGLHSEEKYLLRSAGRDALHFMLESEVLHEYLEQSIGLTPQQNEEKVDTYIPTLLHSLEGITNPALALYLLEYDPDNDTFFSAAPSRMEKIECARDMQRAIMDYQVVLSNVSHREALNFAEEIKHYILRQFMGWLEAEGLSNNKDIAICVDNMEKALRAGLPSMTEWEAERNRIKSVGPLHWPLTAIDTVSLLVSEMDADALDADCCDHIEAITMCPSLSHGLYKLTLFALTVRILKSLKSIHAILPPALLCLMQLYFMLTLSDSFIPKNAYTWIVSETVDTKPD